MGFPFFEAKKMVISPIHRFFSCKKLGFVIISLIFGFFSKEFEKKGGYNRFYLHS